jgi:hypothetical protein
MQFKRDSFGLEAMSVSASLLGHWTFDNLKAFRIDFRPKLQVPFHILEIKTQKNASACEIA